ncbi:PD-(D/E)XK nuclease-like domain-containing protein [Polycladidibacter hongkongensis]|uniref:PD-(D/E)XK nuclease-like domain-containing protein n=1 Tax=Polycladidibacter hongkongensis TaxID=1647556 RepID=UPI00155E6D86|nr:PD-(D/E)XK nuclease-like domain-containing protein [Pseudovibrio hongkongensis]
METINWDGMKVTSAGLYSGLPIEKYHSDICLGPSISSSGLRAIGNGSPASYWATSYLNPLAEPQEDKDHFRLGQAAHTLFLGEDNFRELFVVQPATYPGARGEAKWNGNANYCKDWKADQLEAGKRVLTADQMHTLQGMAGLLPWQVNCPNSGLKQCGEVMQGALDGDVERSLIWQDHATGVWLKARPDLLPAGSNSAVDLKTTRDADKAHNGIADLGYHMQAALVAEGMRQVMAIELEAFDFIFVQTSQPYTVRIISLSADQLAEGRRELRRAVNIFANCLEKNEWPTAHTLPVTWTPPLWHERKIENLVAANDLPDLGEVA